MPKDSGKDPFDIDFDNLDNISDYPLDEVFGGESNKPTSSSEEIKNTKPVYSREAKYYFFPTWRSQFINLCWFFISGAGAIWVSREMPQWFILPGRLFSTSHTEYMMHLPLLIFVPAFFLAKIFIALYNSVYCFDDSGIEAQIGLVSFNLRQPRLRWEDIRGVEPSQNIWERMLGIGTVKVGSAMTQEAEVIMTGVSNPREIQELINTERAKRLKELKQSGVAARYGAVTGD